MAFHSVSESDSRAVLEIALLLHRHGSRSRASLARNFLRPQRTTTMSFWIPCGEPAKVVLQIFLIAHDLLETH